mgnify:CR=1 FL=1
MIHIVAIITTKEGQRDKLLEAFRTVVPHVLEEKGCIEYTPAIDLETNIPVQPPIRSNVVTVIEKWEDLPSLEAHLIAPHMVEYRTKVKDLVANTIVCVLEPA